MPGEGHVYFTAFSSGRKALVMFSVKYVASITISFLLRYNTVEPGFYDRRSNDIPDLTINILCPGKSYL